MLKINFLKANNGDSIHIAYNKKNIIIDTGVGVTYYSKPNGRNKDGEFKKLIVELQNKNEKIDLLIITHWDDDHIGGVLKWFKEDIENAKSLIKNIWFNSGTLINKHFNSQEASENIDEVDFIFNPNTSIRQGISFEKFILDNNISNTHIINTDTNTGEILDGVKFTILSPTDRELKKLLTLWEESPYNPNTSSSNDYDKSLTELLENQFKEDNAIHNGSSIAFILKIEDKKMLFLGDSHPSVIISSLIKLNYSKENKLKIDFVKVSHHGSKANTSNELLELIECDKFIISTDDNSKYGLPNKETFARIINKHENCKLYFNYPNLINKIFTDEELQSDKFEALNISEFSI
jgi:beta-lactamase superfamily II metal-dependent hydrolase